MSARHICEVAAFAFALSLATAARLNGQDPSRPLQEAKAEFAPQMSADPTALRLETGFRHLYELNFHGAREDFAEYQRQRPDDPLGKAAEAASYLFEEFNDKQVLSSEFFLNDSKFLGGLEGNQAENRNAAFLNANHDARELAKKSLKSSPHDVHGLMVLTIADGLESSYDALVEKKHLAAIILMRRAEREGEATLAADPSAQDAYVALGISNYAIGSLPAHKRAVLWIGGVHGDRARGMTQMQSAAEHGHYLRTFARIMLALAYEREGQMDKARELLTELATEFPSNPVFSHELELLDQKAVSGYVICWYFRRRRS